jgi:diguanylate cyclase (GGDEF)-like protein
MDTPERYQLLIIDADGKTRATARRLLASSCTVLEAASIDEAREILTRESVAVVLQRDGDIPVDLTDTRACPDLPRILYHHAPTTARVISAVNRGHAWRYTTIPWDGGWLQATVAEAFALCRRRQEQRAADAQLAVDHAQAVQKVEQRTRDILALNEELRQALDRMHALATLDELTHTWNRRVMIERLGDACRLAHRYRTPLSCLVCDICRFTEVNVTRGIEVGDQVLKEVAVRLCAGIREVDLACRTGSDEFTVILPYTDITQARCLAERLHDALVETPYPINGNLLTLRMSFGIAELTAAMTEPQTLYQCAQEAEYLARDIPGTPLLLGVFAADIDDDVAWPSRS